MVQTSSPDSQPSIPGKEDGYNLYPLPIIPSVIYSLRVTKRFPLSVWSSTSVSPDNTKLSPSADLSSSQGSPDGEVARICVPPYTEPVWATGVDFSGSGRFAAAAGQNNLVTVFDCTDGTVAASLAFKESGVGPVRFTHGSSHILVASDPNLAELNLGRAELLRYFSLTGDACIRSFAGHTEPVFDVAVAPAEGLFVSAALDRSIRLWDLRYTSSVETVETPGRACVKFDPTGRVLAVADPERPGVTLYDLRRISEGGFLHFTPEAGGRTWTSVQFTNDGLHLVLATSTHHHVFDAFKGVPTHLPLVRSSAPSCLLTRHDLAITPNGRLILSCTEEGGLDVWDLESAEGLLLKPGYLWDETTCLSRSPSPTHFSQVFQPGLHPTPSSFSPTHKLVGHSTHPITCVGFNPKYMTVVTGGSTYALWEANLHNLCLDGSPSYSNACLEDYK
ncbi:WD repeat-containing protein 82 [Massospora cicadina]|nr:WD repeat-containing protein 82 [Massospora cicadina]